MTNNTTIDGVSPKRGDRLFHVGNTRACPRGWVEFLCFNGWGEATVRTKNGAVPSVQVDHLQWHAMTDEQQLQEFYSELSNGGKLSKRALCHIRDQQSIIAQLQARIAELEIGWGEPVAWLAEAVGPDGTAYRRTSSTTQITMRDVKYAWGEGVVSKYEIKIQPLFTAPPAPVSTVPDGWKLVPVEPDGNMRLASNRYKRGTKVPTGPGFYRAMLKAAPACLEATAALNEKPKQ